MIFRAFHLCFCNLSSGIVPIKPAPKVYRGKRRLLGVATMHKSNMVPVFADNPEEAVEIAKMRRG